jgi:hypothetical protein
MATRANLVVEEHAGFIHIAVVRQGMGRVPSHAPGCGILKHGATFLAGNRMVSTPPFCGTIEDTLSALPPTALGNDEVITRIGVPLGTRNLGVLLIHDILVRKGV